MCGIIGFSGREQAAPILLDGLERMEYRGYDSAGIAVRSETKGLQVKKTKGRLRVLSDLTHGGADLEGTLGIGHTRWATHGEPNDINAHPHVSENGQIALVHNGIIENYLEIKEQLQRRGVTFTSDTDSEVVAQLLEYHYNECHNMLEAVGRVLRRIEGSYAFGIICSDFPNALIAARKDSPLILGYGENGNFIASDVTAIIKYTRDVVYMEDGEIAVVTPESIDVFDSEMNPLEKQHSQVDWDVSAAEKGGYAHFMFKEIMEQPEAIAKTVSPRIRDGRVVLDDITLTADYVRDISRIFIIACGSSYHVGMVSKYNWERLLRRPVQVDLASEFRYSDPLVDEKSLVVVISQSGETLDTMAAMREAKRRGARTLAVVNVVGSSIAREADDVLYTWAGPEIAVATTKAYSTQLVLMDLIGLYLADLLGTVDAQLMCTASLGPEGEAQVCVVDAGEHPIFGDCLLAMLMTHDLAWTVHVVGHQRQTDGSFLRHAVGCCLVLATYDGDIPLLHLSGCKLLLQTMIGKLGLGNHHQSAGRHVEPMNDERSCGLGHSAPHDGIHRLGSVLSWNRQHSCRLAYYGYLLIFVDSLQLRLVFFRPRAGGLWQHPL